MDEITELENEIRKKKIQLKATRKYLGRSVIVIKNRGQGEFKNAVEYFKDHQIVGRITSIDIGEVRIFLEAEFDSHRAFWFASDEVKLIKEE